MIAKRLLLVGLLIAGLSALGLALVWITPGIGTSIAGLMLNTRLQPATTQVNSQVNAQDNEQMNQDSENDDNESEVEIEKETDDNVAATRNVTETETVSGSLKIATAIAAHFKVTVSDITTLHDSGWGYGEIFKLYLFAQESGKSVADIKAMRDAGQGWGEIAHALNIAPGNHGNNLGAIISASNSISTTNGLGHGNGKSNHGKGK